MQTDAAPERDLVLVGGGHAHALALRALAMRPPAHTRITLISPAAFTPYSGMLPGLLAGHYTFEESHIDLFRLCQWAGVRFFVDTVQSLDPVKQHLFCERRGRVAYDLLSIDIGSQPELDSVPGAREHALPVKPVARLWERWASVRDQAASASRIALVGGGAGSVELAFAIAHRLQHEAREIALYCGAPQILAGYSDATRAIVEQQLSARGISLHCHHRVSSVKEATLHFDARDSKAFDTLIWSTGAAAAPWIADSGLPCDEAGFMTVDDTLQSIAFPNVFAAGDIAVQQNHPRPKAGVYAVRQGPVLARNLAAFLTDRPLRRHRPQRAFLSLLSLGEQSAVAERSGISLSGAWAWQWKDRIDRAFMRRFSDLPPRAMGPSTAVKGPLIGRILKRTERQAPCGGCGAKVGAGALTAVLGELAERYPEHTPRVYDDAVPTDAGQPLLQSVDMLRALIVDPWRMGRIAAQHALSDIYACGARPHSSLALITMPFAASALLARDLEAALDGALSVLSAADCRLLGGHSMQGPEWQLGLSVNGVLDGHAALGKAGARPGDVLLLSKALGSGALFAAHMLGRADGRHVDAALDVMEQSNAHAARVARDHAARAVTDVTGFGLAGHLAEMLGRSLSADLRLDRLPVLAGASAAMESGIFSTLHEDNRAALLSRVLIDDEATLAVELLFDPQTSGGLLMALPPHNAEAACAVLREAGNAAAIIGEVAAYPQGDDGDATAVAAPQIRVG